MTYCYLFVWFTADCNSIAHGCKGAKSKTLKNDPPNLRRIEDGYADRITSIEKHIVLFDMTELAHQLGNAESNSGGKYDVQQQYLNGD